MSSTTSGWRAWRSTAIMALVVPGLFATMALPAYAFTPETDAAGTASLQSLKESGAQSLSVGTSITANAVARDGYSATTEEELAAGGREGRSRRRLSRSGCESCGRRRLPARRIHQHAE
jgi:hypothetical protein